MPKVVRHYWRVALLAQGVAADILLKAAPGASRRLGVVKVNVADRSGALEGTDVHLTWGNIASADYVHHASVSLYSGVMDRPGSELAAEEGPDNTPLRVTVAGSGSPVPSVDLVVWGYTEVPA